MTEALADHRFGVRSAAGHPITFRGVEARVSLAGLMAETVLEQHYRNERPENLEVSYTFPLPVEAVLLGFEVRLGDVRRAGRVVARSEAERRYEAAIDAGDSAFRLMRLADGLYSVALGNLQPGEDVRIRVRYGETLRHHGGRLRYRLPTTIAPRYGEPVDLQPWQVPAASLGIHHGFSARIDIGGALAEARIECPSHRVALRRDGAALVLELEAAAMDRDLVLELRPPAGAALGTSAVAGSGEAIATACFLPPARQGGHAAARDTVVVLDCSGSMAGDSLRLAREGVLQALGCLQPGERFGLLRFGTRQDAFRPRLAVVDEQSIRKACAFIAQAEADLGGTELAQAVEAACSFADGRPLDVLLLTDGEIWSAEDIAGRAAALGHRLFPVGIGAAAAEDTVRLLADRSGGAFEMVSPGEDMPERIAAHFARMRQPEIVHIELDWEATTPAWEARPRRALFAGDAVVVHAAFPAGACPATVAATFHYRDGEVSRQSHSLPAVPPAQAEAHIRMAAAGRLPGLEAVERQAWALQHQITTDDTDYLIVVERADGEGASGLPVLEAVPQMLAAGWGATGTVDAGRMPALFRRGHIASPSPKKATVDDLPAFLRRASRPARPAPAWVARARRLLDALRPGERTTPAALLEALDPPDGNVTFAALPERIEALVAAGLPAPQARRLEALVSTGVSERDVVLAFLATLARLLSSDVPLGPRLRRLLVPAGPAPAGEALAARLGRDFRGVRAEAW